MKQAKLKSMAIDQLVDLFAGIGVPQDRALLNDEISKFIGRCTLDIAVRHVCKPASYAAPLCPLGTNGYELRL